jgi:hypothetical protein
MSAPRKGLSPGFESIVGPKEEHPFQENAVVEPIKGPDPVFKLLKGLEDQENK